MMVDQVTMAEDLGQMILQRPEKLCILGQNKWDLAEIKRIDM